MPHGGGAAIRIAGIGFPLLKVPYPGGARSSRIEDDERASADSGLAVRERMMEYAACNVVYVDRTAREDKLVKRDDPIPADQEHSPGPADRYAPRRRTPSAVDENLRTLLGTFSEGWSSRTIAGQNKLTQSSPSMHLGQVLYRENLRVESSFHRRFDPDSRPDRDPLR